MISIKRDNQLSYIGKTELKYTLRQLEVFLATAHHQSVSRAATELAMSQSAASESLKTLEQQFDIQLFDRVGKNLRLNELGRSLREQAEALIDQAKELEAGFKRQSDIGDLKIGATLSIGNYVAINLMAQFMKQHPNANIELDVANTTTIAKRVRNYELDIGLIEGECSEPDLDIIHWRNDELIAFCNASHPLAKTGIMSEADILTERWILREPGSGTRQTFDWAMHRILPKLMIGLELQHTEAIKRAVEANLGVGCLSAITLHEAFQRGNLVPLKVENHSFERNLYFILHRQKYRSAGIELWMDLCRSAQSHNHESNQ
jgi:DNA-binding transcriptional LysR family regulator